MILFLQLIFGIILGIILGLLYALYLILYLISLPLLMLLPAKYRKSTHLLHKKRKALQLSLFRKISV